MLKARSQGVICLLRKLHYELHDTGRSLAPKEIVISGGFEPCRKTAS